MNERNHHNETPHKVTLALSDWLKIGATALTILLAIGAAWVDLNRRVSVVETKLEVLAVERPKVTDEQSRQLAEIRTELREMRSQITQLAAGVASLRAKQ